MFPETVSPVCSPGVLAQHPHLAGTFPPERLLELPLPHYVERYWRFMNRVDYSLPKDR
ncbi:MAG: hypothetical protein AB3N24_24100 [Leisingera sp.]